MTEHPRRSLILTSAVLLILFACASRYFRPVQHCHPAQSAHYDFQGGRPMSFALTTAAFAERWWNSQEAHL